MNLKVYFGLNTEQRLDVQLISNTNIAVSSDLLDRMLETVKGPELRNWCQQTGLLNEHEDFADKKQRGSRFTVRAARTFIMNFYAGKRIASENFPKEKTIPVLAKTGGLDEDWEKLKHNNAQLWSDEQLIEAGKAFAKLFRNKKIIFLNQMERVLIVIMQIRHPVTQLLQHGLMLLVIYKIIRLGLQGTMD